MQTITCPHCHKPFEPTEALIAEYKEKFAEELEARHKEALEKQLLKLEEETTKKIKNELEVKLRDLEKEKNAEKERREKFMEDLLKARDEVRLLKIKDEDRELETRKKLAEDREKMKVELSKTIEEKAKLQVAELSKKLEDTQKALEDAQRKSQQTSQQLQGEVLELQLEQSIKANFPDDVIEPVGKGAKGADIRHIVKTARGNVCGVILWEIKRTKSWDDKWTKKLKEDLREAKAHLAILVSETLPDEAESGFGYKDGVLICSLSLAIPIAEIMRQQLISVARERFILTHKNNATNAERLFEYVTSHEFLQQIEAMVELHQEMNAQIAKEKAAFEKIWKARELQVIKMLKTTTSISGSLQGILGSSMPQIKGLDLLESLNNED